MSAHQRFKHLAELWFLTEPALLNVYCTHALTPNPGIPCPVRCGRGRIEYNPELVNQIADDAVFEEHMRVEMLRLLLKHPYERAPEDCPKERLKYASDMVLSSFYNFRHVELHQPAEFNLPTGKHYEWYLTHLAGMPDEGKSHQPQEAALAALWQEDSARCQELNQLIASTSNWGSLSENMVQHIIANTSARVDYRRILRAFRASVLSNERQLTRMQPNRRTGFAYMGSRRAFSSDLLLAVDVSGSISDGMLAHFYSVITKFFNYGIRSVDVIQFDSEIKGPPRTLEATRRQKLFEVCGRGGTSFEPVWQYAEYHPKYDGLIILTDGGAPPPTHKLRGKAQVVWICDSEESYRQHHSWMEHFGRVCYLNLR